MDNFDDKDEFDINTDDLDNIDKDLGDELDVINSMLVTDVGDVELFEMEPEYNVDVNDSDLKDDVSDGLNNTQDGEEDVVDDEKLSVADIIYEWIDAAVFSLVVIAFIFTFIARQVQVDGPSMENTLHTGERLIMTSLAYTPKKGDIVIVNRKSDTPLIKRIIATEGDKIEISDGVVYVEGEALSEEYALGRTELNAFQEGEHIVPDGKILILGDNREHSEDSRSSKIGFVSVDDVMGKAVFRFFPIDKFGGLY